MRTKDLYPDPDSLSKNQPLTKFWTVRILSIVLAIIFAFSLDFLANNFLSKYAAGLVFLAGIYVTLAVSLNLINGITGQFSIGHFAFFEIGAYSAAVISKAFFSQNQHSQPSISAQFAWVAMMMIPAVVFAAVAGLIIGLPSLKLKGDYLAIATLGFGEIIRIATENIQHFGSIKTGGSEGLSFLPSYQSIALCWLLAILCIAMSRNLIKTVHGLGFLSVREDEIAANSMGVNTTRLKVLAFIIGSAFAGAAGALYAHKSGFVTPEEFKMDGSILIVTMVIFGGSGSITGSIFAGIVLFYIPELLRDLHNVSYGGFIATIFAVIFAVGQLKRISDMHFDTKPQKVIRLVSILVVAVVLEFLLKFVLDLVPKIAHHHSIDGSSLRIVVLAATLIIMMLFRPQGVFAHHEFSWAWVRKVLRMSPTKEATNGANST